MVGFWVSNSCKFMEIFNEGYFVNSHPLETNILGGAQTDIFTLRTLDMCFHHMFWQQAPGSRGEGGTSHLDTEKSAPEFQQDKYYHQEIRILIHRIWFTLHNTKHYSTIVPTWTTLRLVVFWLDTSPRSPAGTTPGVGGRHRHQNMSELQGGGCQSTEVTSWAIFCYICDNCNSFKLYQCIYCNLKFDNWWVKLLMKRKELEGKLIPCQHYQCIYIKHGKGRWSWNVKTKRKS